MVGRILQAKIAVEVTLFVGGTIGLAFFAQKNMWLPFAGLAAFCTLLYAMLRFAESARVLRLIKEWQEKERELLTTLEKCGIRQIFNMQDPREQAERNRVCGELIYAGSEFSLSGSTGASYVNPAMHRHWDAVRRRLDAGCAFRLLLTSPFCPGKVIRNRLNGVISPIDPKLDLANLARLRTRYPNLEIRFTDEIYCSVFFTEGGMIYDPYHLGQVRDRLENRFMAIQLVDIAPPGGTSYFRQLKNHFEFLWREGTDWDTFTRVHSAELAHHM